MTEEKTTEYILKLVVLGDAAVGKTSLINQYIEQSFLEDYKPTLGVNILTKEVNLKNSSVRLVLWDLAAQAKYDLSRTMFFQGCSGAVLIYDITRPSTKSNVKNKWYRDLLKYAGTKAAEDGAYLLLGNKSDLKTERRVSKEEGDALCQELNAIEFIETSAKYGENVEKAFQSLVSFILKNQN